MAVTVKVNGSANSLVHKSSTHIATCTVPDVCKTPSPAGPVPIPYPIIVSMSSDLANGSTTVKADGGNMIAIKGCEFSMCTGDEAGTAGGVKSGTFKKEAKFILYSFDVKIDGKNACRLADKLTMNHENTVCLGGAVGPPVGVAPEVEEKQLCPHCGRGNHDTGTYPRSASERKKALLRDAQDPNSGLSARARKSILKSRGNLVPRGHEVSHEEPLYTKPKSERCKLDKADNMKTQTTREHRKRHKACGDQFHDFPR